jgi:hypothetical protein
MHVLAVLGLLLLWSLPGGGQRPSPAWRRVSTAALLMLIFALGWTLADLCGGRR